MSAQRNICSAFVLLGFQYFKFVTTFKKSTEGARMSYMFIAAVFLTRGIIFLRILATDLQITLFDTSQTVRFTIDQSRVFR